MRAVYNLAVSVLLSFVISLLAASTFFTTPAAAQTSSDVAERRAELEQRLEQLETEISSQGVLLESKRLERVSLERDIAILDAEIKRAQLSIQARNLEISRLGGEINNKEEVIGDLNSKLSREKQSLAQLLRKTNEIDDSTLVEVVLGNQNLSDFFEDLDAFTAIKIELQNSFVEIEETKVATNEQKEILAEKQVEEVELKQITELEKRKIEAREREKQIILDATKGQESAYQTIINSKQQTAAQIRTALFQLRGTAAIPFGEAVDFANAASAKTGVRPALILGVIAQESNLGENVGQCLLTNTPNKGDGKGVNTGRYFAGVMKPTRDVDPFLAIVGELGINPSSQVVSCPPSYGYGGAMGPAQFIPSTWVLYKERIAKAVGHSPPNPWDPQTAFFATALLMMDNGADGGTRASERLAALRYFAGWKNAEKPAYGFYGDGVLELADKYQGLMDVLASS